MSDHHEGLHMVPEHMRASIVRWIEHAEPRPDLMGSFLRALLSNDLMAAFNYADEENTLAMRGWALFLYNDAPSQCFGSPERVQAWYDAHHLAPDTCATCGGSRMRLIPPTGASDDGGDMVPCPDCVPR